jgi:hypothetical protein
MVEAIRAAAEFLPNISGISLKVRLMFYTLILLFKGNRLSNLNFARSFVFACPSVIELDLSDNQVSMHSLIYYSFLVGAD